MSMNEVISTLSTPGPEQDAVDVQMKEPKNSETTPNKKDEPHINLVSEGCSPIRSVGTARLERSTRSQANGFLIRQDQFATTPDPSAMGQAKLEETADEHMASKAPTEAGALVITQELTASSRNGDKTLSSFPRGLSTPEHVHSAETRPQSSPRSSEDWEQSSNSTHEEPQRNWTAEREALLNQIGVADSELNTLKEEMEALKDRLQLKPGNF